jgi:hypothetical protein
LDRAKANAARIKQVADPEAARDGDNTRLGIGEGDIAYVVQKQLRRNTGILARQRWELVHA